MLCPLRLRLHHYHRHHRFRAYILVLGVFVLYKRSYPKMTVLVADVPISLNSVARGDSSRVSNCEDTVIVQLVCEFPRTLRRLVE